MATFFFLLAKQFFFLPVYSFRRQLAMMTGFCRDKKIKVGLYSYLQMSECTTYPPTTFSPVQNHDLDKFFPQKLPCFSELSRCIFLQGNNICIVLRGLCLTFLRKQKQRHPPNQQDCSDTHSHMHTCTQTHIHLRWTLSSCNKLYTVHETPQVL